LPLLVDRVDQGHAGMAFAAQLDVQHHHVVGLARQRGLGIVAVEPLVDLDAGARGPDPAGQLVAGGQVVFDHGYERHASSECWLDYPGAGPAPV
jgi:hypothetical protein